MIKKIYTPKRTVCKVTFKLPKEIAVNKVALVGDFNDWNPNANELNKTNYAWQTTLRLKPGTETKFRYFIDDQSWANDDTADGTVKNEFGTEDSVLKLGS
ncbi:MAG: isoamylase early set domain-containing protein [Balneolales bacterium]